MNDDFDEMRKFFASFGWACFAGTVVWVLAFFWLSA